MKITVGRDVGLDATGAQRERVDVAQHLRDGLGCDEAELLALGDVAGNDTVEVLGLVDVAEEAADVLRVLGLVPQAAAVGEADVGVLGSEREDVRVEVAEGRGEEQGGAVLGNHALHGLLHRVGLGHVLFLDHLDAGHLLHQRGRLGVRLVVAVVIARTDVDEPDAQHLLAEGQAAPAGGGQTGASPAHATDPLPAIPLRTRHSCTPVGWACRRPRAVLRAVFRSVYKQLPRQSQEGADEGDLAQVQCQSRRRTRCAAQRRTSLEPHLRSDRPGLQWRAGFILTPCMPELKLAMSYPYLSDVLKALTGLDLPAPVPTFGLCVMGAVLVATACLRRELQRRRLAGDFRTVAPLPTAQQHGLDEFVSTFAFVVLLAGVLGARVFHILEHLPEFLADPWPMIFSRSGLSIMGGLVFGAIAGIWVVWRAGLPLRPVLDGRRSFAHARIWTGPHRMPGQR